LAEADADLPSREPTGAPRLAFVAGEIP
jgi:hypothetical protein